MSLAPSLIVNFDGEGLTDTQLTVTDADGVAHLHRIKPGSEMVFDVKFTGVDVSSDYTFVVEFRDTNHMGATLMTSTDGDIVITKNPTGADTERIRIQAPAASTAALDNRTGAWGISLYSTPGAWQDLWVQGIWQTEERPVKRVVVP